jgi:hypothetical protein
MSMPSVRSVKFLHGPFLESSSSQPVSGDAHTFLINQDFDELQLHVSAKVHHRLNSGYVSCMFPFEK